jgi:hypothetical protein
MFNNEDSKMKLQELAPANPTKQAAKIFESHFGQRVSFDTVSRKQAKSMLKRVRAVIAEHRRTPGFHSSEQDPAYLKLIIMEQALATQASTGGQVQADPKQMAAAMTLQRQQKQREIDDAIKMKQKELPICKKRKRHDGNTPQSQATS